MTTLWKTTATTIWILAQVAEKKLVEGSDNEDLISLDGDVSDSDLIEDDGFDAREDEEWGGIEGAQSVVRDGRGKRPEAAKGKSSSRYLHLSRPLDFTIAPQQRLVWKHKALQC